MVEPPPGNRTGSYSPPAGVIVAVDRQALVDRAARRDAVLTVLAAVGDFLSEGTPLIAEGRDRPTPGCPAAPHTATERAPRLHLPAGRPARCRHTGSLVGSWLMFAAARSAGRRMDMA